MTPTRDRREPVDLDAPEQSAGPIGYVNLHRDTWDDLIAELRASRKVIALGSTLANRVIARANIQGPSKVRLLYEEERAAEAFEAGLTEADSSGA